MKRFLLFLAMVAMIMSIQCNSAHCGVMNFGWNKYCETGNILDMEFMPDNNFFIMATERTIDIRSTATGELVKTFPIGVSQIEFPHDSTKILTIQGARIQLRNLEDMSIIKEFISPNDEDSVNYSRLYYELAVDPKKPFLYSINRSYKISDWFRYSRVHVINCETMEYVNEMLIPQKDSLILQNIAVSKDGKYLACSNEGYSHLMVWSLETMQNIRYFSLNPQPDKYNGISGEPKCIKFSESNSDGIYYSGFFPQFKSDGYHDGLFLYNIAQNKITDSTFGVGKTTVFSSYFSFFNDENNILITNSDDSKLKVIDLKKKELAFSKKIDYSYPLCLGKHRGSTTNTFIGSSSNCFAMGYYDSSIGVDDRPEDKLFYPNPTTGLVNIQFVCNTPVVQYELFNINGNRITELIPALIDNNAITIDMTSYLSGIYFIKVYCNSYISTYKIIKED